MTVPVFDEVALFEPSDTATLSVLVTCGPGGTRSALQSKLCAGLSSGLRVFPGGA